MSGRDSVAVPRQIGVTIGRMRRAVQRYFLVDGLKSLLLILLAVVFADFFLDKTFRMDKPQRVIMFVLIGGFMFYIAWKRLLLPLFSRLSDDALLLQLEQAEGGLDESLISALELSRMDIKDCENVSAGLVQKTISQGVKATESVNIKSAFKLGRMRANSALLSVILLCFVCGVVSANKYEPLETWFKRNVLLKDVSWPSDYFLNVFGLQDGEIRVPRGDDWTLLVSVKEDFKSLPDKVTVEYRTSVGNRSESMAPNSEGDRFRGGVISVLETFDLRVLSREYETEWIAVEVVERPKLNGLSLRAVDPEYTGLGSHMLPSGEGPYNLLKGTKLKVEGTVDKDLRRAAVTIGETSYPMGVNGKKFAGELPKEGVASGTYSIEVEDMEEMVVLGEEELRGLGTREKTRFKVRIKKDRKPRIVVALEGVSGMVVPGAKLPYTGKIDDDYAIESAEIQYSWKEDNGEREEVSGSFSPAGIADLLGGKEVSLLGAIELEAFEIPVNSRFSLQFSAKDNDTESGPNLGQSTKILLRVVGEAELRTDLLRREKEQRQILLEMVKKQDLLLTDTGALAATVREVDVLGRSEKEQLTKLQKRQKLMGASLKSIVVRLKGMVSEIINNQLEEEDGVLKQRLRQKVILPLAALAEEVIPSAAIELDASRRMSKSAPVQVYQDPQE